MDVLTREQRRKAMQANKSQNTKIEIMLRKALWKQGVRYRINCKEIPGKPDIVIKKYKLAIFCDGNFWHGKSPFEQCSDYWINKIKRNKERDLEITVLLRDSGWLVLRFWESEIKRNLDECVKKILEAIESRKRII